MEIELVSPMRFFVPESVSSGHTVFVAWSTEASRARMAQMFGAGSEPCLPAMVSVPERTVAPASPKDCLSMLLVAMIDDMHVIRCEREEKD